MQLLKRIHMGLTIIIIINTIIIMEAKTQSPCKLNNSWFAI